MIRMIVDIIYRLLRGYFLVLLDIPEAERGVWPRQPSLINHYEKAIWIASTFNWLHSLSESEKVLSRCPHQLCTCLFDRDRPFPFRFPSPVSRRSPGSTGLPGKRRL